MLPDAFVCQERFFGVVLLGQFLFVGDDVMDSVMTFFADHETPLVHLLLAEAIHEPLLPMDAPGNQVVFRERLSATA